MREVKKESGIYLRYSILFILVTVSFLPFSNVISWGSDYAGYILQAKAIHNFDTQEFINTQNFLINLSENPKYPIYTPIGMPLLISVSSFLTKFDMYLVRIIIPISVFFVSLIIYKKNKRYPFLYSLIFVLLFEVLKFRYSLHELFLQVASGHQYYKLLFFYLIF